MTEVRGNTDLDRALANIIMQTDAWREQQVRTDRLMERFDSVLDGLSVAVTKLDVNVGHLSDSIKTQADHAPRLAALETRCSVMDEPVKRWVKFEERLFYYAVGALLLGAAGGLASVRL